MWTISNILSLARIFLAAPLAYYQWNASPTAVVILIVVAWITDVLDGFFARKYDQISEIGKIIDPIADKIFVGCLALILVIQGKAPMWYIAAVVARDLLIMAGSIYVKSRTGKVLASNYTGKATVISIGVCLIAIVLEASQNVQLILMTVSAILMLISFTAYAHRAVKALQIPDAQ